MDVSTIPAAIAGLKRAGDVIAAVARGDLAVANAELKLKMADLLEALADARIALLESERALEEKDQEVARLVEAFQQRGSVGRSGDAMFRRGDHGQLTGEPFCLSCYERDSRLISLVDVPKEHGRACPTCRTVVTRQRSYVPGAGHED